MVGGGVATIGDGAGATLLPAVSLVGCSALSPVGSRLPMQSVQIGGVGCGGCYAIRGTAGAYGQGAGITGQGDAGTEACKCARLGGLEVGPVRPGGAVTAVDIDGSG